MCLCVEARGQPWVVFFKYCLPCVLRQGLSLAWNFPSISNTSQECGCLHLPSAGSTSTGTTPADFVFLFVSGSVLFLAWVLGSSSGSPVSLSDFLTLLPACILIVVWNMVLKSALCVFFILLASLPHRPMCWLNFYHRWGHRPDGNTLWPSLPCVQNLGMWSQPSGPTTPLKWNPILLCSKTVLSWGEWGLTTGTVKGTVPECAYEVLGSSSCLPICSLLQQVPAVIKDAGSFLGTMKSGKEPIVQSCQIFINNY